MPERLALLRARQRFGGSNTSTLHRRASSLSSSALPVQDTLAADDVAASGQVPRGYQMTAQRLSLMNLSARRSGKHGSGVFEPLESESRAHRKAVAAAWEDFDAASTDSWVVQVCCLARLPFPYSAARLAFPDLPSPPPLSAPFTLPARI